MRKFRLKITLKYTSPTIFRVIEIPCEADFKMLHCAIQSVFNWDDCHPYEFVFEKLGIKVRKSTNYDYHNDYHILKRRTLLKEVFEEGVICNYVYDLSTYWAHTIECIAEFNSFDHSIHICDYQGDNISEEYNGVKNFYYQYKHPEMFEVDFTPFDVIYAQKLLDRFTDSI